MRTMRWLLPAILALTIVVAYAAVRRLAAGELAWNAAGGELEVAGPRGRLLPRGSWRPLDGPELVAMLPAASREGAGVRVTIAITPPPGRHRLAPAPAASDGLALALGEAARAPVAAVPLECVARAECALVVAQGIQAATAARLGLGREAIKVELAAVREARAAR